MKTYNNLFDKIANERNVEFAIYKAAEHKRHKKSVQKCLNNAEAVAKETAEQLRALKWRPLEIHNAREINDGITLKKRLIVCPEFKREQIVHHAIMRVCAPLFMRKFYKYSCGSIPKRGPEYAAKFIAKHIQDRSECKYYCWLDIKKFFENIRPYYAFKEIKRTIRDRRVLLLFAIILRYNKLRLPNGEVKRLGAPIGFYTSPWIGNIILNPLDHLLKEMGVKVVCRFVDDILLMDSGKRRLIKAILAAEKWLAERKLRFKYKPEIHRIDGNKITYVGFKFDREKVTIRDKTFLKAIRTAKRIKKKGSLTVYDARKVVSYAGRFKHADAHKAFEKHVLENVSIRKCKRIISRKDKERCGEMQKAIPIPLNTKNSPTDVCLSEKTSQATPRTKATPTTAIRKEL